MIVPDLMVFNLKLITEEEVMLTIVGMGVVFVVLTIIYIVFQNIPKLLNIKFKKRKKTEAGETTPDYSSSKVTISGEVNAAISTALYLYLNELHDEEETILTIQRVSRTYSPWSSKIYSVMNFRR